uniref:Ubiquitin fusion degradation protein 1 homolog n=1 Tax=Mesocestoides corti TaxID=53468 RepID=A0A5K3FY35_MESCO
MTHPRIMLTANSCRLRVNGLYSIRSPLFECRPVLNFPKVNASLQDGKPLSFVFHRTHFQFEMLFPHMGSTFSTSYQCFSHSFTPGKAREDIKDGGKTRLNAQNPMTFKLTNPAANRSTHCGVLEFVADEGRIYVPYWMLQNLCLEEGDVVHVKSIVLPVATFAKFQPQSESFLDISNPKAVLEYALRKFACLTVDDMLAITYNDTKYELKVLELQPARAVRIIECDMSVDFAPPVGYVEKHVLKEKTSANDEDNEALIPDQAKGLKIFGGAGCRLDGRSHETSTAGVAAAPGPTITQRGIPNFDYQPGSLTFLRVTNKQKEEEPEESAATFRPFEGQGVKLKPSSKKLIHS